MVKKINLYKNFNIKNKDKGSIILIGSFDGLHLGHRKLFERAKKLKSKSKLKIGVFTFDPIPKMFFSKGLVNYRISNLNENLDDGLLSNFENFSRIVSISLFFLYLFTLNLLYRFISYGKPLYLFLVVAGIVLNYFSGSVIFTAFSGMLDQIGGLISGAILILLYFSPVKENFR